MLSMMKCWKDVSGQERDRGHGIRKSGWRRNSGRASLIFPLGCRCPFDCIIYPIEMLMQPAYADAGGCQPLLV